MMFVIVTYSGLKNLRLFYAGKEDGIHLLRENKAEFFDSAEEAEAQARRVIDLFDRCHTPPEIYRLDLEPFQFVSRVEV